MNGTKTIYHTSDSSLVGIRDVNVALGDVGVACGDNGTSNTKSFTAPQ